MVFLVFYMGKGKGKGNAVGRTIGIMMSSVGEGEPLQMECGQDV